MAKLGGKLKFFERFDCDTLCSRRGEWQDGERRKRGCTRIDLPIVRGDVEARAIHRGGWMGRLPVVSSTQAGIAINPKQPTEDPDDGCPGGWYRSRFVASVMAYLRRRDDHGGRVDNLLLLRSDDEVLMQLVHYTEDEQERSEAAKAEVIENG